MRDKEVRGAEMEEKNIVEWKDFEKIKMPNYYCYSKMEGENKFLTILLNNYNLQINPKYVSKYNVVKILNAMGGKFRYRGNR